MKAKTLNLRLAAALALAGAALTHAGLARANDFPTVDRVNYVQECMRTHPGNYYEMVNKCSCALDALAREVSYDDYVTMSTATNGNSMGGERGNAIRDVGIMQAEIKRFRELQTKVKKGCFINTDAR